MKNEELNELIDIDLRKLMFVNGKDGDLTKEGIFILVFGTLSVLSSLITMAVRKRER